MAIISANLQYNRGEHKLLDYSSLQSNYTTALNWATDVNSNAAVGQFIYIENDETINEQLYSKGPYIVNSIGKNAVITKLQTGNGSNQDLTEILNELKDLKSIAQQNSDNIQYIIDTFTWAEIQEGGVVPQNVQINI